MLDFSIPTILFTVINILVLFLFLKKFLFGRVNAIMEKRAQMVQADLDHAKETVAEAEQLKTNYLETMSGAQSEAKELIAKAQKIANEQRDQITQQAQRDADRIMANARRKLFWSSSAPWKAHSLPSQILQWLLPPRWLAPTWMMLRTGIW